MLCIGHHWLTDLSFLSLVNRRSLAKFCFSLSFACCICSAMCMDALNKSNRVPRGREGRGEGVMYRTFVFCCHITGIEADCIDDQMT